MYFHISVDLHGYLIDVLGQGTTSLAEATALYERFGSGEYEAWRIKPEGRGESRRHAEVREAGERLLV